MSTVTLTFSLPEEKVEAGVALRAMEIAGVLRDIDSRARFSLKHSGDHAKALEEIREMACGILGWVDGDGPVFTPDPKLFWPVADLGIMDRSTRCLASERIFTVHDLIQCSETELLKTPNLGRKSLNEIKAALADHGLSLRGPLPKNDPHPTEAHQ